MNSLFCAKCNTELLQPFSCKICNNNFHENCDLIILKSPDNAIFHICGTCAQLDHIRKNFSSPPSRERSNSSTSSNKRMKDDLETLYQQSIAQYSTKNSAPVTTSAPYSQPTTFFSGSNPNYTSLSLPVSMAATSSIYNPQPLITINLETASLQEINEAFYKNFELLREDFNQLNNVCKIQHQFVLNCSTTISGHANILKAHEGQLEDSNFRLRSFEVDYSSNLMISGLENIENPNVDLKCIFKSQHNQI